MTARRQSKTAAGRFFADFCVGDALRHATQRRLAAKNRPCADFSSREGEGYEPHVALDLDDWAIPPR
jgi:hypothetical protein